MTTEDIPPDEAGQQRVIEEGAIAPDVKLPWAGDPRGLDRSEIDEAVFSIRSRHECRTGCEARSSALRQRGLPSERATGVLRSVRLVETDRL